MITSSIEGVPITIEMERCERHVTFGESGKYWRATVKCDPSTYIITQLPSERSWYFDAHFHRGIPVYCHGDGSRCCMKRVISEGPLFDLLNQATKEVHVTL